MCFSANVTLTSMFVGTSFQRNSFLLTGTRLAKACTKTKYQLAPNWGIKPNTSFKVPFIPSYFLQAVQRPAIWASLPHHGLRCRNPTGLTRERITSASGYGARPIVGT